MTSTPATSPTVSSITSPAVAPFGTWKSPITAEAIVTASLRLGDVAITSEHGFDQNDHGAQHTTRYFWLEGRPHEKGRTVLVMRDCDGTVRDLVPHDFNVRTRAHEYGGGAYAVAGETVYFSNDSDGRIYRSSLTTNPPVDPALPTPEPLTPPGKFRYADLRVDVQRDQLIAIREDASSAGEPIAALIAIALHPPFAITVLAAGETFYASPALSPDGSKLAWLSWNHPDMPWDSTTLWVADVDAAGVLGQPIAIAGGEDESIFQPQWSPDGRLFFVSDRNNWWNLYACALTGSVAELGASSISNPATDPVIKPVIKPAIDPVIDPLIDPITQASNPESNPANDPVTPQHSAIVAVYPIEAEFATPQWVFGMSTYGFTATGQLLCTYTQRGLWFLATIDPQAPLEQRFQPIDLPYSDLSSIRVCGDQAIFLAGSPTTSGAVVSLDLTTHTTEVLQRSTTFSIDPRYLSEPQPIEFPTSHNQIAYGFYYPPKNPDFIAPDGDRPPLLVKSHGGPTAATSSSLSLRVQYWTSRGFGYLDVNYRGSTGYGRTYRHLLRGQWGIFDVDDAVYGAQNLVDRGWADPHQLAISGGSAGGYTVLSALTFRNTFKAGASYYGISDLEALAQDTHKFEARYLDRLVGAYPQEQQIYRDRSPIHFSDQLDCPVIFFQGLEDKVVPPNQAEMMVNALRTKGLPVAYVPFEGEQHGFRQAATIQRAIDAEFYFYARVFGFTPADAIEPVAIENL